MLPKGHQQSRSNAQYVTMAQQPGDLRHVQAVLEGRAPVVAPSHGQQQRRGRAGTPQARRQSRTNSSGTGQRRQQEQSQKASKLAPQSRGKQQGRSASARSQGCKRQQPYPREEQVQEQEEEGAAEQYQAPASPYNQPGPKSTPRVWHCTACDVWVPRREGDWKTHTSGIRHRRQLLSLRVHGERGKLVLSAFESLPGPREPAYRLVGRAAQQFGLLGGEASAAGTAGSAGSAGPGYSVMSRHVDAVRGLRTQALTQLLHLYGVGQTYSDAAHTFTEPHLGAAVAHVALLGVVGSTAGGEALEGQQFRVIHSGTLSGIGVPGGCVLAAASRMLRQRPELLPSHVRLQVGAGEIIPFAWVAAELAGLHMLLPTLGACPALAHLIITLRHRALGDLPGYQLSQLQRAWGGHLVRSLGGILELNASIRCIKLEVPSPLYGPTQQQLPALHSAAQAAPLACRQHLLLALHPRVGRCSLIQLLPLPLLREVMQLAAPLEPCQIEVQELPGPG